MKILVICSENYSFDDGGPLAKTVGSLVHAYRKLGVEVLGFSPLFSPYHNSPDKRISNSRQKFEEKLGNMEYGVQSCKDYRNDLFIQKDEYFFRDGIYGKQNGKTYGDNHLRFSFLASAALDYCQRLDFKPDAIHVHEWSGIAGALTKTIYKDYFAGVPVLLTVQNISYDYHCSPGDITKIGLLPQDFNMDGYEYWGKVSMLKAAMLYSDKVVFTSLSYLFHLLLTDSQGGMRGFLDSQEKKLFAIQSGIDYEKWSIPANVNETKLQAKNSLCRELGLEADSGMLMYVHLDEESGNSAQVMSTILADLLNLNITIVIGIEDDNPNYSYFSTVKEKYREKMALIPLKNDDENLRRRFLAADLFFSIKTSEPSLSIFLKAFSAGAVVLTNARSQKPFIYITAFDVNEQESYLRATAFVPNGCAPDLILEQVRIAEAIFCKNKSLWSKLMENATSVKVSWESTAKNYLLLLRNNI